MWISRSSATLIVGILLLLAPPLMAAQGLSPPLSQDQETKLQNLPQPQEVDPDCRECHWDVYLSWEQSAHGRGLSCGQCHLADEQDHARQGHGAQGGSKACMGCHTTGYDPLTDTWEEDNVHCTACHTPIPVDHPKSPMPTDRSEALCGQCHIQARFEWQDSPHGQAGVLCVSCHSQHSTSLKSDTVSAQCANCHEALSEGFSHSLHSQEGLSCANCHLAPLDGPVGEGSAKLNHTFGVEVNTCVSCHKEGLHNAAPSRDDTTHITFQSGPSDPTDAMASSTLVDVSPDPPPVNPLGFVALSSVTLGVAVSGVIIGVAIVILPWAGARIRRLR